MTHGERRLLWFALLLAAEARSIQEHGGWAFVYLILGAFAFVRIIFPGGRKA